MCVERRRDVEKSETRECCAGQKGRICICVGPLSIFFLFVSFVWDWELGHVEKCTCLCGRKNRVPPPPSPLGINCA